MLPCTYNIQQKLGAFFSLLALFFKREQQYAQQWFQYRRIFCLFVFFQEASTVAKQQQQQVIVKKKISSKQKHQCSRTYVEILYTNTYTIIFLRRTGFSFFHQFFLFLFFLLGRRLSIFVVKIVYNRRGFQFIGGSKLCGLKGCKGPKKLN